MLRISRLLRGRTMNIPLNRDGVPFGWERPDPPPPVPYQLNKRLDHVNQLFFWTDSFQPLFMLNNYEIYEGGLIDAAPRAITMFFLFLASAAFLGGCSQIFYRSHSASTTFHISYEKIRKIQASKKEQKVLTSLQQMKNNPLKVNVWPETYPHSHDGVVTPFEGLQLMESRYQIIKRVNKESLDYINAKIDEGRKKVLATERGEGHAGHGASHVQVSHH